MYLGTIGVDLVSDYAEKHILISLNKLKIVKLKVLCEQFDSE